MGGGKSNSGPREKDDFYATNPQAIFNAQNILKEIELYKNVWECACGTGNISESLISLGYNVKSSDKVDRGYGKQLDFLTCDKRNMNCDIVTNPPFKYAEAFIRKSMEVLNEGRKACFFLKIQFLESKKEKFFLKNIHPNMFMCILKDKVALKIISLKFMVGVVHGAIVGLFLKKDIKEKQFYVGYRRN